MWASKWLSPVHEYILKCLFCNDDDTSPQSFKRAQGCIAQDYSCRIWGVSSDYYYFLIRRWDLFSQYLTRHQICFARGVQNTYPEIGTQTVAEPTIQIKIWSKCWGEINFFNKLSQLLTHQQPCRRRWSDPSGSRCGIHTCTLPSGWCRSDCKFRGSCTHRYLQKRSRKGNHEGCVKKEQLVCGMFNLSNLLNASVWIIKSFYGSSTAV